MKKLVSILLTLAVAVSLFVVPAVVGAADVELAGDVYDKVLVLENKDASWKAISDTIGGKLGYNDSRPNFVWGLEAKVLENKTQYALIYYADKPDRFSDWGGDNPGALIALVMSDSEGVISDSGIVDLGMDLPCPPDANQFENDYSGGPDNYIHAHGAKIWLVPLAALPSDWPNSIPWTTWDRTSILFETDLIWYDDTDGTNGNKISISVDIAMLDFGVLAPGADGTAGDVTITNDGNVPVDVTAELNPVGGVFQYLYLNNLNRPATGKWSAVNLGAVGLDPTDNVSCPTKLQVPAGYTERGKEAATLIFWATLA